MCVFQGIASDQLEGMGASGVLCCVRLPEVLSPVDLLRVAGSAKGEGTARQGGAGVDAE